MLLSFYTKIPPRRGEYKNVRIIRNSKKRNHLPKLNYINLVNKDKSTINFNDYKTANYYEN